MAVVLDTTARRIATRISSALLLLLLGAEALPSSAVLYVDDNDSTCAGLQPCFSTVQGALLSATDGEIIEVQPGTYVENIVIPESLEVVLRSTSGPTSTILDGGGTGPVVWVTDDATATVEGFTIQNAGGSNGFVTDGRGVAVQTFTGQPVRATIRGNIIRNNPGSGVYAFTSVITIDETPSRVEALIESNQIVNNFRGILVDIPSSPVVEGFVRIVNNVIAFNEVDGGSPSGAGISLGGCCSFGPIGAYEFDVVNNTIFANAAVFGGGLAANASNTTLANNILFANTATQAGDDLYLVQGAFSNLDVRSNIIGDGQFDGQDGNQSVDPQLVDPQANDLHLGIGSPAIDGGFDGVSFLPLTDFEGDPRVVDGDGNQLAEVDIGADEFVPEPSATVLGLLAIATVFALKPRPRCI